MILQHIISAILLVCRSTYGGATPSAAQRCNKGCVLNGNSVAIEFYFGNALKLRFPCWQIRILKGSLHEFCFILSLWDSCFRQGFSSRNRFVRQEEEPSSADVLSGA